MEIGEIGLHIFCLLPSAFWVLFIRPKSWPLWKSRKHPRISLLFWSDSVSYTWGLQYQWLGVRCQNAKIPTLDKTFYKTSYSRFILSNLYLRIVYIMTGFLAFWHITSSRYYHVTSRFYHVIYHCIYAVKIFLYIWYHIFISPTSNIQWNLTKINLYS